MVMIFGIAAAIIAVCLVVLAITIHNNLISLSNQVNRAFANIDVLLKQRFDEIPQLVKLVEQFVGHEQDVIRKITEARSAYGGAKSIHEKIQASQSLSSAFHGVLAIGEGYPELKSSDQFINLQSRVSTLEEHLADRRELYNDAATNFNTRISQFPDAIFAGMLNYRPLPLLRSEAFERARPELKLNLRRMA